MVEVYKMDIQNQTELKETEEVVEEVVEEEAGEVKEADTAAAEEPKADVLSVEDIASGTALSDVDRSKQGTPKWFQSRFDKITREKKEAEERARELEEKLKQIPINRPAPPRQSEFETDEEYSKAFVEWKDRDDDWKESQKTERAKRDEFEKKLNSDIQQFVVNSQKIKTKYPDFQERIDGTVYSDYLKPIIIGSELGPEIGYYLTYHPEELNKLNTMDSIQAARAIGKLEERFTNVQKKTTNAPPPIKPVKGGLDTEIRKLDEIKEDDEWLKAWKADKQRKLQVK
jgi:hypothetical protein